MAKTTIIQVPVKKSLRDQAVAAAQKRGFSSLQDVMRFFLSQFVENKIDIRFTEPPVQLSKRAAARYDRMTKDFEANRHIRTAHSVKELMKQLNA
jgi:antitoxin component of RelBE/YafQ-DinJ toxin-antitoxin module